MNMYTIMVSHEEIRTIRRGLLLERQNTAPGSNRRKVLESLYEMLLETTASDDVARRMQDEGDKFGHD